MVKKEHRRETGWRFPKVSEGWIWELDDESGILIGRSSRVFPTESACRENARLHALAPLPPPIEEPDDSAIDVDGHRVTIEMLERVRAVAAHSHSRGFSEGRQSALVNDIPPSGAAQKCYLCMVALNGGQRILIDIGPNPAAIIAKYRNKRASGATSGSISPSLVWYQAYDDIQVAAARQQEMRGWDRQRKIGFIEAHNPEWKDLLPMLPKHNPVG